MKNIHLQQERQQALENARTLTARVLKRRKGVCITDTSIIIEKMRIERLNELLQN